MYIDTCKRGKYVRHLLRENYRENGKVKHRTIANLSHCSDDEIQALKLAFKHKKELGALGNLSEAVAVQQGLSVGAICTVYAIAERLGIVRALGPTDEGRLALWQVIARVIDQGSRLSAVRLATSHAACDLLNLKVFDEDDLYEVLDWLSEQQERIEDALLRHAYPDTNPDLYLYDVTSSYLEGQCNEYAAFGYNRDGKKSKRQIVIGLLCDDTGRPLSIEVFPGNTRDTATFSSQVMKVAERFGGGSVTFVGDRGMIKGPQIAELAAQDAHAFHYITAITKPQIRKLLKTGAIQMSLFDKELAEVFEQDGTRYILRQNPIRAEEMQAARSDRQGALRNAIEEKNIYLAEHPRAHVETALRQLTKKCEKLKLSEWSSVVADGRKLSLSIDQEALKEASKLDGCYVLKTDLATDAATKETIHSRYKDLSLVETAFRVSKTVLLEMRPIYVRLKSRTRGHALVVMLAYLIARELAVCWSNFDLTVQEALQELSSLTSDQMLVNGQPRLSTIPIPRETVAALLKAADVKLPKAITPSKAGVATKRKLPERRKSK